MPTRSCQPLLWPGHHQSLVSRRTHSPPHQLATRETETPYSALESTSKFYRGPFRVPRTAAAKTAAEKCTEFATKTLRKTVATAAARALALLCLATRRNSARCSTARLTLLGGEGQTHKTASSFFPVFLFFFFAESPQAPAALGKKQKNAGQNAGHRNFFFFLHQDRKTEDSQEARFS